MSAAPHQLKFRGEVNVKLAGPLISESTACSVLECDNDELKWLIESRKLSWAWNIARPGAEARELRLLTRSVNGVRTTGAGDGLENEPEQRILDLVLARHPKPELSGTEFDLLFCCSQETRTRLLRAGLLTGTDWKRGPNGSPKITRLSVIQFLKERREQ